MRYRMAGEQLFLFNPENDIALGLGAGRFTPPRQAALLHMAGAILPFWLGDAGDYVLVDDGQIDAALRWKEEIELDGPSPVSSAADLPPEALASVAFAPWGWSLDAVAQFERAGFDCGMLAKIRGMMNRHRMLSHRRTALKLLDALRRRGIRMDGCPEAIEARCVEDVVRFVMLHGGAMLKSPWSSSGRGVFPVTTETLGGSLVRVTGIVRRQGSVMVEPLLPRVQDFAMLFNYDAGEVEFAGLSLFYNSTATNYGGNLVASDEEILRRLSLLVQRQELLRTRDAVADCLPEILEDSYSGPLGVDMMVYCVDGNDVGIAPCVEVNLRTTMGFVARGVYKKLGKTGVMSVAPVVAGDCSREDCAGNIMLAPRNPWFDFRFSAGA